MQLGDVGGLDQVVAAWAPWARDNKQAAEAQSRIGGILMVDGEGRNIRADGAPEVDDQTEDAQPDQDIERRQSRRDHVGESRRCTGPGGR